MGQLYQNFLIMLYFLNKIVAILAFIVMIYLFKYSFGDNVTPQWTMVIEQGLLGIFFWYFADYIKSKFNK